MPLSNDIKQSEKVKKLLQPKESSLHQQVVNYLKLQYKDVIFRTDFAAGIKMTMGQAVKHKKLQCGKSYPDLFIAKANNGFHGLFIEIKKDADEVFCKDGALRSNEHIGEQNMILMRLKNEGYKAVFGCGFEHCKRIIDNYLK